MEPASPHRDARLREIRLFIESARRVYGHDAEHLPSTVDEQRKHDAVLARVAARFGRYERLSR